MRKTSFVDQLKNLKHGQQLLAMAILLLVVSVAWIFLGIFTGQQSSSITPAQKKASAPLTPQLDETILEEIENKKVYSESELDTFPIYKIISINRGKEQTIVPITFDESELSEDSKPRGSLESISSPTTPTTESESATQDVVEPSTDDSQSPDASTPPSSSEEPVI